MIEYLKRTEVENMLCDLLDKEFIMIPKALIQSTVNALIKKYCKPKQLNVAKPQHWIYVEDENWYGGATYKCSGCGTGFSVRAYFEPDAFEHCPKCGSYMENHIE